VYYVRGAARSRGGKPIIALPSTAKDGSVSCILPVLEAGAGVATSRGDVHYVVTEYGVADLWGKTVRERALALLEVAHPDFRPELMATAKARHYVFPKQPVPRGLAPFQADETVRLRSGETVRLRAVRMADADMLQRLFYSLSDESTYQRFLCHKKSHPVEEIMALVDVDHDQSMALVAALETGDTNDIVGMARYDVDPATQLGDVALAILDSMQGKGLGTELFRRLVALGRARGLAGFSADVLIGNSRMLAIFNKSGLRVESQLDCGTYRVRMLFDEEARELRESLTPSSRGPLSSRAPSARKPGPQTGSS